MTTTTTFKDVFDLPEWKPLAVQTVTNAVGMCNCSDMRNSEDRIPIIFYLTSAANLYRYNYKNDGISLAHNALGLAGTFGAGACSIVMPSRGPRGTLTAVASASKMTLSALPNSASIGINQFAQRPGDDIGYKIRIYDKTIGKMDEKYIIANTSGNTPTITLDSALSFTPTTSANYELLSGRVYMLNAGTNAAGIFKYFDIATQTINTTALANTNLPATVGTDSCFVALDEGYIPCDATFSTGFFGQCTASASTTTSITITCPQTMLASELVGFQVRVIQDTGTVGAVGQRRKITASTAGTSVTLTVPTWTTQPSSTAVVVIENNNDLVLFSSGSTNVYCYDQEANTWATATYAARGAAVGAGLMAFQPFGVSKAVYISDPDRNFRYTTIHTFSGGGATTLSILNLHTNTWENAVAYQTSAANTFNTGSCLEYDAVSTNNAGRFAYINQNATTAFFRYNAHARTIEEWTQLRYPQSTATVGSRMALASYIDSSDGSKYGFLTLCLNSRTDMFQILAQR